MSDFVFNLVQRSVGAARFEPYQPVEPASVPDSLPIAADRPDDFAIDLELPFDSADSPDLARSHEAAPISQRVSSGPIDDLLPRSNIYDRQLEAIAIQAAQHASQTEVMATSPRRGRENQVTGADQIPQPINPRIHESPFAAELTELSAGETQLPALRSRQSHGAGDAPPLGTDSSETNLMSEEMKKGRPDRKAADSGAQGSIQPAAPQLIAGNLPMIRPATRPSLSLPISQQAAGRSREPRVTHVRIGTIEVRAAQPSRPEPPAAGSLAQGFDNYARLRSYIREDY